MRVAHLSNTRNIKDAINANAYVYVPFPRNSANTTDIFRITTLRVGITGVRWYIAFALRAALFYLRTHRRTGIAF